MKMHMNTTGMPMPMPMTMWMTFHTGIDDKILFDSWQPQNIGAFIGSWIAIFLMAVTYEGLKSFREYLHRRKRTRMETVLISGPSTTLKDGFSINNILNVEHLCQSALHSIQIGFGYLLMLIAMTFNIWLFLAVVLGSGVGYLIFSWGTSYSLQQSADHCN